MVKHICMVAYSNYLNDTRIRREAETLSSIPGYMVLVLALKELNSSPKTYTKDGVKVQELNIAKYRGKSNSKYIISYFIFMLLAFFTCSRLLINKSLDIIHIHNMPNFLVFSGIIPLLFGKKIILDVHDTMIETYSAKFKGSDHKLLFWLLHLEELLSCALAHKIICVNHVQRQVLIERGIPKDKMIISMNVPDPKKFYNVKISDKLKSEGHFRLVFYGTIAKRLGIDLAIRAIAELYGKIPGLELHILGGGDDIHEFIDLSRELKIQEIIHIYDKYLPIEEIIEFLKKMDVVIVPNRKNAATELMLPVKLLEGVVLGLPVIVPRLKTIEYYFSEDMVYYFEPDNVDSMADAMINAYNNETERKEKVRKAKRFTEKYGWEIQKFDLINL